MNECLFKIHVMDTAVGMAYILLSKKPFFHFSLHIAIINTHVLITALLIFFMVQLGRHLVIILFSCDFHV